MDMSILRWRLKQFGYRTAQFSYPSIRHDCRSNAARLQRFVEKIEADEIHFVAHSLGGLIVRHLLYDFPDQKPGRVVTLATPHQGSFAAQQASRRIWGRWILGNSLSACLLGDLPAWNAERELGSIAGNKGFGVGMLMARLTRPHDGTVTVAETELAGMSDHITLPVTHVGMMLSVNVANQVQAFLDSGQFNH